MNQVEILKLAYKKQDLLVESLKRFEKLEIDKPEIRIEIPVRMHDYDSKTGRLSEPRRYNFYPENTGVIILNQDYFDRQVLSSSLSLHLFRLIGRGLGDSALHQYSKFFRQTKFPFKEEYRLGVQYKFSNRCLEMMYLQNRISLAGKLWGEIINYFEINDPDFSDLGSRLVEFIEGENKNIRLKQLAAEPTRFVQDIYEFMRKKQGWK